MCASVDQTSIMRPLYAKLRILLLLLPFTLPGTINHYKCSTKEQRRLRISYRDIRRAGIQLVRLPRNSNAAMAERLPRIKIFARHVKASSLKTRTKE